MGPDEYELVAVEDRARVRQGGETRPTSGIGGGHYAGVGQLPHRRADRDVAQPHEVDHIGIGRPGDRGRSARGSGRRRARIFRTAAHGDDHDEAQDREPQRQREGHLPIMPGVGNVGRPSIRRFSAGAEARLEEQPHVPLVSDGELLHHTLVIQQQIGAVAGAGHEQGWEGVRPGGRRQCDR